MNIRAYLPSAQFTLMVLSIAFSAGLVFAADFVTKEHPDPISQLAPENNTQPYDPNWEAALYAIQAQNASTSLIAPSDNVVGTLLDAAQSPNITETVGRTLLIKLTDAKSQGLGDDIPTQNQLISAAISQTKGVAGNTKLYAASDITTVLDSDASLRAYGNAVMKVLAAHPEANTNQVLLAIGQATDNNASAPLSSLSAAGNAYIAIAHDLQKLPVPKTMAPFHLTLVNEFLQIGATFDDMQTLISDPLRGLTGLQTYESLIAEASRVFTQIAQNLNKDGILFGKDEPGSAWSSFLTSP